MDWSFGASGNRKLPSLPQAEEAVTLKPEF
jgi:hypothetical protein